MGVSSQFHLTVRRCAEVTASGDSWSHHDFRQEQKEMHACVSDTQLAFSPLTQSRVPKHGVVTPTFTLTLPHPS